VPLIIFLIIQRKLPAFFYLARPVKQHNHFSGMNIACARAHAKNSIAPKYIRKNFPRTLQEILRKNFVHV
jgi:hypothetical protein